VCTYTHLDFLFNPLFLSRFSPTYTCPFLSTRYRSRHTGSRCNKCAATHDRLRISFDATESFTPLFTKNKNASSSYLIKAENTFLRENELLTSVSTNLPLLYRAYVSAITTITIDNCCRRAESPAPFTSAKLSVLIARKIRSDFETRSRSNSASLKRFKARESADAEIRSQPPIRRRQFDLPAPSRF